MGVPHIRVELQGTLANGAEKWSAGFSTAPPTGGALADVADLATTAQSLFVTNVMGVSVVKDLFPTSMAFTGVRCQQIEADGTLRATASVLLGTPAAGTQGLSLPAQCAVVVSLRTATPGARGRGRLYLPSPAADQTTVTGRLLTAARDLLAEGMANFFDGWNADASTMPVGVASSVGGFVTTVTSIQVGDVIDTQRRRRDTLPESYKSRTLL